MYLTNFYKIIDSFADDINPYNFRNVNSLIRNTTSNNLLPNEGDKTLIYNTQNSTQTIQIQ